MVTVAETVRRRLQLSAEESEAVAVAVERTRTILREAVVRRGPGWYVFPAGYPTAEQALAGLGVDGAREAKLLWLVLLETRGADEGQAV